MKRLSDCFHGVFKHVLVDYELPSTPKTDFIVDDSSFLPIAEALKNLQMASLTTAEKSVYYDFPDGKDDGSRVPINRRHDIKDITEISAAIVDEAKINAIKLEHAVEDYNNEVMKENFKKMNASNSSPSAPPSSSN